MNDKTEQLKNITIDFLNKIDEINPDRKDVGVSMLLLQQSIIESLRDGLKEYYRNLPAEVAKNATDVDIGWFKQVSKSFNDDLKKVIRENENALTHSKRVKEN